MTDQSHINGSLHWTHDACGVTSSGRAIPVLVDTDMYDTGHPGIRVVVIGGLSGHPGDVDTTRRISEQLHRVAQNVGLDLLLSVIPSAYPDCDSDPNPDACSGLSYPPKDGFFGDSQHPESRYLWRWISLMAPDLLLEVQHGESVEWHANAAISSAEKALDALADTTGDSLISAIGVGEPSGLAPVPGLRLTVNEGETESELKKLVSFIGSSIGRSPARRELDARRSRSPIDIARLLGRTYGKVLDPVIYTQGVAISGRLRLAELEKHPGSDEADVTQTEVLALLDAYLSGEETAFGDKPGGQHLAGLVWADELTSATGDPRPLSMLLDAADRYHSAGPGLPPPPSDDNFRTEDMFFTSAVLGRAFAAFGKSDYIDMGARFLADADTQKPDGLFMHCQGADWNWGRSNGFACMGFAELLTYLPENHELYEQLLGAHIRHLEALLPLQQPDGTWLQLLDYPGSYHEMSVTCMVGYAIARGIRSGWLDSRFRNSLDAAWNAAVERIDNDGGLIDVCTGTGVQTSTREYLDRGAEFGFDHRGGSMALWFAVEMERLCRDEVDQG